MGSVSVKSGRAPRTGSAGVQRSFERSRRACRVAYPMSDGRENHSRIAELHGIERSPVIAAQVTLAHGSTGRYGIVFIRSARWKPARARCSSSRPFSIAGAAVARPGGDGFSASGAITRGRIVMSSWVINLPASLVAESRWVEFSHPFET